MPTAFPSCLHSVLIPHRLPTRAFRHRWPWLPFLQALPANWLQQLRALPSNFCSLSGPLQRRPLTVPRPQTPDPLQLPTSKPQTSPDIWAPTHRAQLLIKQARFWSLFLNSPPRLLPTPPRSLHGFAPNQLNYCLRILHSPCTTPGRIHPLGESGLHIALQAEGRR